MIGGENIIELDIFKIPLPFESNTSDYVLAKNILEHIPHNIHDYGFEKNFLVIFIDELHRIMKDSAILEIQVPSGISTFMDSIDHKRVVTPKTFHIYYKNDPYNYYTKCRFELISERRTPTLFRAFNFVFRAVLSIDIYPLYSKNVRFYLRKL